MPVTFPEWDEAQNRLVEREYRSLTDVATMLHISRTTAYDRMKQDDWPHLEVASRVWFSDEDLRAILSGMRHNGIADGGAPALGEPLPEDPWPEADGGGVR